MLSDFGTKWIVPMCEVGNTGHRTSLERKIIDMPLGHVVKYS